MQTEYEYRTGRSWGVTIVRTTPAGQHRAEPDRLIATAQAQEDADLIVAALNVYEGAVRP